MESYCCSAELSPQEIMVIVGERRARCFLWPPLVALLSLIHANAKQLSALLCQALHNVLASPSTPLFYSFSRLLSFSGALLSQELTKHTRSDAAEGSQLIRYLKPRTNAATKNNIFKSRIFLRPRTPAVAPLFLSRRDGRTCVFVPLLLCFRFPFRSCFAGRVV